MNGASDDDGGPFTVVQRRRPGKHPTSKKVFPTCGLSSKHSNILNCGDDMSEELRETIVRKIAGCRKHLKESGYFDTFRTVFGQSIKRLTNKKNDVDNWLESAPDKIICYGIGNFGNCQIARYQLALIMNLHEFLGVSVCIEFFDPVFTSLEKNILSDVFQFKVILNNEEGKRVADKPTLFYLPHFPNFLVSNLLSVNWSEDKLKNCVLICNSFQNVKERVDLTDDCVCFVSKTDAVCEEFKLPNNFQYKDIFNDTSIHIFPEDMLKDPKAQGVLPTCGLSFKHFSITKTDDHVCEKFRENVVRQIADCKTYLVESAYTCEISLVLKESIRRLENRPFDLNDRWAPDKIVCYGLGNFSKFLPARYQLALIMRLQEDLNVPMELYDPAFTNVEKKILSDVFQFKVLLNNEEGKRVADKPTLFYLPHLPNSVTNNLLSVNWSEDKLRNCILICNSFQNVRESSQLGEAPLHFIARADAVCKEFKLPGHCKRKKCFYETSIHVFPEDMIKSGTFQQ